jgi:hypothetical protein
MSQASLPQPGFSPVEGCRVEGVVSDGGTSSNAGALILAEIARDIRGVNDADPVVRHALVRHAVAVVAAIAGRAGAAATVVLWLAAAGGALAQEVGPLELQLFNTAELANGGLIERNDVCAFALHQADRDPAHETYAYAFFRPLAISADERAEMAGEGSEAAGERAAAAEPIGTERPAAALPTAGPAARAVRPAGGPKDAGPAIIQIGGEFVRLAIAAAGDPDAPDDPPVPAPMPAHRAPYQLWTAENGRLLVVLNLDIVTGTSSGGGGVDVPSGIMTVVREAAPPFWIEVAGGTICTARAPPATGGPR